MERATLSLRREASRARGWWGAAVRDRDLATLARVVVAGSVNLVAAALDRVRPARWWCPCCGRVSSTFLWVGNRLRVSRHAVCPACGSRSRHRGLALVLSEVAPGRGSALHFAPEAPLADAVAGAAGPGGVVTTDLHRADVDRPGEDIQELTFAAGSFDLVVCNHVLEHVADDRAAMAELARVTAPAGVAVVSVPGDWTRHETVDLPDLALNGHHRDYGTDVVDRLRAAFTTVEVLELGPVEAAHRGPGRPGLRPDDRLFVCRP